jgi:NADPH:quinone reductase-like Zn-dependent oxidoreductase
MMMPMTTAVLFDQYGPPEVLRVAEIPDLHAGPGQVRVRVLAAGVQPFDIKMRRGDMTQFLPLAFPSQVGNEYAGVVDQVGDGVTGINVGDPVLGSATRVAAASHLVVDAADVVAKPAELDFPTAAGLVAAAQTATGALLELGAKAGETLLVHAAAGSVGTIAVQVARELGLTVIGTASPANHDYLRELGAIPVAYGDGLVGRVRALAPDGVDLALDAIGGDAIALSTELVADRTRIGTIVNDQAATEHGARTVRGGRSPQRLAEVVALATQGKIVMPIRPYAFADVIAAHRDLETGHGRGKIVLILE